MFFAVNMWWRRGWRPHVLVYSALALAVLLLLIFIVVAVFLVSDYDFRALSYLLWLTIAP